MKIGRYTGLRSLRRTSVPAVPPKPSTQDDKLEDAKDANTKDDTKEEDSEPYTPKRRALLIGISYSGADPRMKEDGYGELRGSHADVAAMRRLLVGRYGYREGDVVVLFDGEEGTIQPTRVNILRAIDDLVRGARKGDRFFFHYCGHTTQIENHSNSEENGMDECLVPIDGEPQKIMDNELRLHLVSALPVGSSLVAVFDSCHSASLLDLAHFRCNRVYVPWLSKGRRRSDERWNAVVRKHALPFLPLSKPPSRSSTGTANANPVTANATHSGSETPTPFSRSSTMNAANNARSPQLSRSATMNTNAPPLPETENRKEEKDADKRRLRKPPVPKRKATKREMREAREVMALQMIEGGVEMGVPASLSLSSPGTASGRKAKAQTNEQEGVHEEEEEPEEIVPTPPMVTTRRIYEAARTGRRVRAWRTEVGALEVGYSESDEVVASGDSPDFLMGEEERGTQGAGEGKKRLARAGTVDEVRGGKKHEHEHEHKAGGEKNKNPKHSSLPLPLVPLRLGSLSLLARVKQAQPTAQGENKGKGKDKTPTTTTTTKRRTTVVRARAVSVAVRPDAGATPAPGLAVPREHHGQEEQEEAHKGREEGYGDGVGEGEDGQSGKGAIPASWLGEEDDAEWRACESPEPIWVCTDFSCREAGHRHEWEGEDEEKAEVDQQISWEDASGGSMTRELVRILDRDPHPTLRSLLTKVSDAFPRMSLEWQLETLRYKRDLKRYNKLVLERNATAAGSATRDADAYSQTTERQMPHQPRCVCRSNPCYCSERNRPETQVAALPSAPYPNARRASQSAEISSIMQSVALPASDHQNPEDIETGTFVIYSSHDDRPEARVDPFTTNDLKCIQSNLSTGGCLTSIHDPEDAVSWMEDNWNNPLLSSIRNSSCGGPFAWMLSPTKPALAIFGSNEPVVVNMAQSLADSSGFPVIIRPATDNPALTLLTHDPESHNGLHGTMRRDGGGDDPMIGDEGGPPESGNSGRNEGDLNDAEFDNGGGGGGDGGGDGDLGDGEFDNGGGGGGDDPGPLTIKDKWESPLHRTSVKLRLKVNKDNTYPVNISYTFKFGINSESEIPIDLGDLARPLCQPEVIALVDLKIETRPRETQVDRSYACIGFVAHRKESIADRQFLHRGFDLPDKLYKWGQQRQTQRGFQGALGFSQGSALATTVFSYSRNKGTTMEATDSKVMPKCCVNYDTIGFRAVGVPPLASQNRDGN